MEKKSAGTFLSRTLFTKVFFTHGQTHIDWQIDSFTSSTPCKRWQHSFSQFHTTHNVLHTCPNRFRAFENKQPFLSLQVAQVKPSQYVCFPAGARWKVYMPQQKSMALTTWPAFLSDSVITIWPSASLHCLYFGNLLHTRSAKPTPWCINILPL